LPLFDADAMLTLLLHVATLRRLYDAEMPPCHAASASGFMPPCRHITLLPMPRAAFDYF